MNGWSTTRPALASNTGYMDWLNEKIRRKNRFDLAYTKASIEAVVKQSAEDEVDFGPVLDLPVGELTALLRGSGITLPIQLHPWSRAEIISEPAPEDASAFYVPAGHRLLEPVFTEFVAERFIDDLFLHLDAYAEIYTFGDLPPESEDIPWRISDQSRDAWREHLRRCYLPLPWRKEPWVEQELTSSGLERLRLKDWERQSLNSAERHEFLERVLEDRNWPVPVRALYPCAQLLSNGPLGFWEKHRVALTSEFRAAFIDARRSAFVVADNGKLTEVGRDWWQGAECTRMLHALSFTRADGVLLERVQPLEVRGTVEQRIATRIVQLLGDDGKEGGASANRRRVLGLLRDMVGDGRIPLRSHTTKEITARFHREFPADDASGRCLESAIESLLLEHPELRAPLGRPSKK